MYCKKKEILIIIIAFLMNIGLNASRYEVFKINGNVMIENGGKWKVLKVHTPLDGATNVRIESSASLGIKDKNTKSIYYYSEPGEISVVKLIMNAKKRMQNKTSSIVRTLSSNVGSNTTRRKGVLGVTNRGMGTTLVNDVDTEIQPGTLEYVLKELVRGNVPESSKFPHDIKWKVNVDSDSIASYMINFQTSSIDTQGNVFYFINVLKITEDEGPRFMFQSGTNGENLSVAAGENLNVNWFPALFDPQAKYLLFVSETPYRIESLQNIMNCIRNGKIKEDSLLPLDKELRQSAVWILEINS